MIEKVNTNGRQTGRTTELISKCAEYNYAIIVCPNRTMADFTFNMARDMKLDIPLPITFREFAEGRFEGRFIDAFLIDNLEIVLGNMARGVPIAEVVLMDQGGYHRDDFTLEGCPSAQPEERTEKRTETHACDSIGRQMAIDAIDEQIEWCDKSLSSVGISMKDEYAVKVERASLVAFRETLEYLPPARPEYEPVTAEDFAKTMSETSFYSYMVWHSEALSLMERQGFVICKKTM